MNNQHDAARTGFLALVAMLLGAPALLAQGVVSRAVGYVQVEVQPGAKRLVGLPFEPFDSSIESLFGSQLTGGSEAAGDRILRWDRASQTYVTAVKIQAPPAPPDTPPDQTGIAAGWYQDVASERLSRMQFAPGDGFWIENRQDRAQKVFVCGEVLLDQNASLIFAPGLNLFSYPFLASIGLDATALKASGAISAGVAERADQVIEERGDYRRYWLLRDEAAERWVDEEDPNAQPGLVPGKGYWYRRQGQETLAWAEPRPYDDAFGSDDQTPRVTWMERVDDEAEVRLEIATEGAAGERLEVYRRAMDTNGKFDCTQGWRIAQTDIQVGGAAAVRWTDTGALTSEELADELRGRCYLVARGDLDADGDGLPDARERFIHHTDPRKADTDDDGMPDGWELANKLDPLVADGDADPDGDGLANAAEYAQGTDPRDPSSRRTLYVDSRIGSDANDGLSAAVSTGTGPTQTIAAALRLALDGDTVSIASGDYPENVDLRGLKLKVVARGGVALRQPVQE